MEQENRGTPFGEGVTGTVTMVTGSWQTAPVGASSDHGADHDPDQHPDRVDDQVDTDAAVLAGVGVTLDPARFPEPQLALTDEELGLGVAGGGPLGSGRAWSLLRAGPLVQRLGRGGSATR